MYISYKTWHTVLVSTASKPESTSVYWYLTYNNMLQNMLILSERHITEHILQLCQ